MVVTEATQIHVNAHVHAREFDGELVIVDLTGGDYFGLDDVGRRMWVELTRGLTPNEIAALLTKEYEVDEATLVKDTMRLIEQLVHRGLVTVR